ncbi:MAG: nicotinate-nucleotide adenylyltransferase [Acidobacteriota bacterium]
MKRNPGKRIGIFGGTFDPPHLGHLILAEEIREDFRLQEVYFMPCHEPPHKSRIDLTEAKHRFAMVVAATLHNPDFIASPIEVSRPGKSYSIDTLRALRQELGPETEMLFVSGLDSFLEIETWKDFEDLLNLCHTIVVSRPGHGFDEIPKRLPGWIVDRLVDLRSGNENPCSYLNSRSKTEVEDSKSQRLRIFLSDAVHVDISSTGIRERIREGRSIRYSVPVEVQRYIEANGLYRKVPVVNEAAS